MPELLQGCGAQRRGASRRGRRLAALHAAAPESCGGHAGQRLRVDDHLEAPLDGQGAGGGPEEDRRAAGTASRGAPEAQGGQRTTRGR
eukprot:2802178-Lingulodinium_polyedra.AAC.1